MCVPRVPTGGKLFEGKNPSGGKVWVPTVPMGGKLFEGKNPSGGKVWVPTVPMGGKRRVEFPWAANGGLGRISRLNSLRGVEFQTDPTGGKMRDGTGGKFLEETRGKLWRQNGCSREGMPPRKRVEIPRVNRGLNEGKILMKFPRRIAAQ